MTATGDEDKIVLDKPKAIVLKILGVVCKTTFKNQLISYSVENCSPFLDQHLLDENILKLMPKIRKFYDESVKANSVTSPECPTVPWANFTDILSIEDENQRKKVLNLKNPIIIEFKKQLSLFFAWAFQFADSTSPVNEIQNYIWLDAYCSNKLKADFYEEAPTKLKAWKEQAIKLFTFSSGTVYAQQVIFSNTTAGNLISLLDGQISSTLINLDKKDTLCYGKIAEIINDERKSILFISPSVKEIKAATISGFTTCLLRRERRRSFNELSYKCYLNVAHDLNQIVFK